MYGKFKDFLSQELANIEAAGLYKKERIITTPQRADIQVNAGEDRGKQGKVLEMIPDKQRAIVEGINLVSKHTKPNAAHPQGGIIKKEAPIHISNLNVVDPVTGKPTKVGRRRNAEGKLVRYAKKSGQELK